MRTTDTPIPAQLTVVGWPDPAVDAPGVPAPRPQQRPDAFTLEVAELAQALGLGAGTAHHSPICRTLRRLVAFDLARFVDESTYAVRRRIAPASASQLRRLNPELRWLHTALLARHDDQRLAARAQQVRKGA